MEESKSPLKSKTLWTNFLGAGLALFYPPLAEWIASNPTAWTVVFAVANVGLRLVTKNKIELT